MGGGGGRGRRESAHVANKTRKKGESQLLKEERGKRRRRKPLVLASLAMSSGNKNVRRKSVFRTHRTQLYHAKTGLDCTSNCCCLFNG